ncbi:unnamed protein product [Spodoptera littoralis]|uniref:Sodium channel protein Nach n=1 Tax=Spodoptera littoralis TaxID=7109 RepID=A0A9P0N9Q8_SPOLI|nr:unnamed protein product [Spodoptera littoralis]CAH1647546.1 unnamed protein product [Spodoptera littoralis]
MLLGVGSGDQHSNSFLLRGYSIQLVCKESYCYSSEKEKEQLKNLQAILDFNNMPIEVLFKELSPATSCGNLVQQCMWKNSIYSCDEMFKQIYTLLSLCCTFNYFAVDNIENNQNELMSDKRPLKTPRRVASCGYQTALTVLLYTNPDDYYSATIASQGALVIIDNAYNIPDLDSPVRMVNPSTELLIALSPERTYTTSGIRTFKPDQRQCYYSDEIKIGNFRQYSFHNCMAYKKVSMLKKHCNCIPLSFPKEEAYRFCNFSDMDCLDEILNEAEDSNVTRELESKITCYPECEHYDYPLEVALGNLADSAYVNGLLFFDDVQLKNRSLLNVFFNDLVSTRYRRDVYLNWQNILAAFGGLLSLMLGFTLISGFDLILFFTVRVAYERCTTMTRKPQNNKIYVNDFNSRKNWMDNTIPNLVNPKPVQNINNTTKYKLNNFLDRRY